MAYEKGEVKNIMKSENAVVISIFKLKKEVNIVDFMIASDKLNDDYLSKQKGYISRQLLSNGDIWTDIMTYDTIEDIQKVIEIAYAGNAPAFTEYVAYLDEAAEGTCDYTLSVKKVY